MVIEIGLGAVIAVLKESVKVAIDLKEWVERRSDGIIEKKDLKFLGDEIGVILGSGNLHDPAAGVSPYIRSAAGTFIHAAGKLSGAIKYVRPEEMESDSNLGGLLLGGPVANAAYRKYCGYELTRSASGNPELPVWQPGRLRWGFFLGTGEWGHTPANRRLGSSSSLEPLTVSRWDEDGKLMKGRPRYGIVDNSGAIRMLPVDEAGYLAEDYLLITRLERTDAPGRYLTMIAGTHGYTTAAFGRNWRQHTALLRAAAKKHGNEFQALVPARVDQRSVINGLELEWERAEFARA